LQNVQSKRLSAGNLGEFDAYLSSLKELQEKRLSSSIESNSSGLSTNIKIPEQASSSYAYETTVSDDKGKSAKRPRAV
ncbi:hypothetical protein HDU99_006741, partial [Rhizoclosmatium hyalinum]